MATSDEKFRIVDGMLQKIDCGVRQYLDWITTVKQIDKKAPVKVESKTDLDKWRVAFADDAKKTGIDVNFTSENTFDLKYLSFTIQVHFNSRASVDSVVLIHPAIRETELDILQLLKTPQNVPEVFALFSELLKSMLEASREDSSELSKIITGLTSIYSDLENDLKKSSQTNEMVLSSPYGLIVEGKSCFLRPLIIYYCHSSIHQKKNLPLLSEFRCYVNFLQTPSSFTLQVAHNNMSNVFTYASVSGVYMLVLEKPVLLCFAIYRKIQDLCRTAGVLNQLKAVSNNHFGLPSMRETTPMFPRELLKASTTDRLIQNVPNHNLKLAISVQWEKNLSSDVLDPCQWVQSIPFCDTKTLANIIYLLRLQQRFNSLLVNSCETAVQKDPVTSTSRQQTVCLPLNIMVHSLMSFTVKCRHPLEDKFLTVSVSLPRTNDSLFNEPKLSLDGLDSLLSDSSEDARHSYVASLHETFQNTWSLSALGAFIWQSFLPPFISSTIVKEEKSQSNELANSVSPTIPNDGSLLQSKANRRVSILEEILAETEAFSNNNASGNQHSTAETSSSPVASQRLPSSNSWLPNSANVTSFEPPAVVATAAPTRPTTNQRGRPRKHALPGTTSTSAKSPGSKKRPSLPTVSENTEQEMASFPFFSGKPKSQSKRGRRVSTSPSTSSPAFSMQPSPAGSRHGAEFFSMQQPGGNSEHHQSQTPTAAMTPAFSFPSEYGGNEESVESCLQSTPSEDKTHTVGTTDGHTEGGHEKEEHFPSPPLLIPEEPPRPGSEEEEKGLVICEPIGYEASPVFDDRRPSPSIQMLSGNRGGSLSRPSSSMSSDQMRIAPSHRSHQRIIMSSDESEQSSSNSLPETKPDMPKQSISPGASGDHMRSSAATSHGPTGSAKLGKPGTTKLLALNDIFDVGNHNDGQLSRNQRVAALDRVLMKNRQDQHEDAFGFNERDPVAGIAELKAAAARQGKRPAPAGAKPPKASNSSGKRSAGDDQRHKQPKQRKVDDASAAGVDPSKAKDKAKSDASGLMAKGADFTRPLPTNAKSSKKAPSNAPPGSSEGGRSSQGTTKHAKSSSLPQASPGQHANVSNAALAAVANPLSSFRIPKKKDTSAADGSGKRPGTSPVAPNSNQASSNKNLSSSGSSTGSFRQRTSSFDSPKDKGPPTATGTGIPEPTPIPLSASYPQPQKQASDPTGSRSFQHHKSQPDFASSGAGDSLDQNGRRKSGVGQDANRSSSSQMRRTSGHGRSNVSGAQSSAASRPVSSSASAQRSNYDNSRRPPAAAPTGYQQPTGNGLPATGGDSYVAGSNLSSSSYPQPPPAHQRYPPSAQMNSNRSFAAHSSSSGTNYSGDYSSNYSGGGTNSGGGGGSWYDNSSSLGGSNYRSFFDQHHGDAPIQSPEPYGQQPFESQPPVIIATSPVRHHQPPHGSNYY